MEGGRQDENVERSARTCLLALCGLPGAGKTTLSRRMVRHLTENHSKVLPKLISFDEVGEEAGLGEEYSPEVWKANRRKAHSLVESELKQDPDDARQVGREKKKLVIVDDNMHLRSMRRQMYLLARKHRTAFVILYLEIPLSVALESNDTRRDLAEGSSKKNSVVPARVITKMNKELEVPDGKRNKWESKSIRVSSLLSSQGPSPSPSNPEERLWKQIDELWQEPVPMEVVVDASSSSSSSRAPSLSEIHQFDLAKRKELSSLVEEWRRSGLPKEEIQTRAKRANQERKKAMADFKCRTNVN